MAKGKRKAKKAAAARVSAADEAAVKAAIKKAGKKAEAVMSAEDVAAKIASMTEMTPSQLAAARKAARAAGKTVERVSPMKGKKHSKEAKQKISAAVKKRYAGYKWRSPKAAWDWKKSDNPNQLPLAVLKARRDRLSGLITQRGGK